METPPKNAKAECDIVQPVNLKLGVKRNLSISWYQLKPEMEIKADLPNIRVQYYS